MSHTCHATGCQIEVPPAMLMCRPHWAKVPKPLQRQVWANYQPGQEITKTPTRDYLGAARNAINAVALKEGKTPTLGLLEAIQDVLPGML